MKIFLLIKEKIKRFNAIEVKPFSEIIEGTTKGLIIHDPKSELCSAKKMNKK